MMMIRMSIMSIMIFMIGKMIKLTTRIKMNKMIADDGDWMMTRMMNDDDNDEGVMVVFDGVIVVCFDVDRNEHLFQMISNKTKMICWW